MQRYSWDGTDTNPMSPRRDETVETNTSKTVACTFIRCRTQLFAQNGTCAEENVTGRDMKERQEIGVKS